MTLSFRQTFVQAKKRDIIYMQALSALMLTSREPVCHSTYVCLSALPICCNGANRPRGSPDSQIRERRNHSRPLLYLTWRVECISTCLMVLCCSLTQGLVFDVRHYNLLGGRLFILLGECRMSHSALVFQKEMAVYISSRFGNLIPA